CHHQASLRIVNKKVITATETAIAANPSCRSAKLRLAEKL
ncbi:MAG: 16S rRNA (cytosine(1402)-N(4))-methyltransferase, partial [Candidatus Komeilibacteria bacterium]|nr:16S rRNA (cytosine(1402)-N(4))-methyltransferase [Candidatus Komeilibacteria bacterium]